MEAALNDQAARAASGRCAVSAYLDEMTWRFMNRENSFLFRDTMLKLIVSDSREYKELT